MRLILDKEHRVETFTKKCDACEGCEVERVYYDYDEFLTETKSCKECEECQKHSDCSEVIFSGYIGEAFCDLISIDFKIIIENISSAIYKESGNKTCTKYNNYVWDIYDKIKEILPRERLHFLLSESCDAYNSIEIYNTFYLTQEQITITYNIIYNMVVELFGKISCYKEIVNKAVSEPNFLKDDLIWNAINELIILPAPMPELTSSDAMERFHEIYKNPQNAVNEIIKLASIKPQIDKKEKYQPIDLNAVAEIFFELLHSTDYVVKKCKNCGKYFIPQNRSDEIYCDRISPQDENKSCKEYGAQATYKEKLQNDETLKLYRRIYMQKQMLVKRNPDIEQYKNDFEKFKSESKIWKKDVKENRKTEDEYLEWLKTFRKSEV